MAIISFRFRHHYSRMLLGVCVVVTLALLIYFSIFGKASTLIVARTTIPTPPGTPISSQWHSYFNEVMERERPKIIFLGGTTTEQFASEGNETWNKYFASQHAVNFGIHGDKAQNLLWRIQNGPNLKVKYCPKLIVLNIGAENILEKKDSPSSVVDGIIEVLNSIRKRYPKTKILMSLLPMGRTRLADIRVRSDQVNKLLSEKVHDVAITGMNIGQNMLNSEGYLPEHISADGIHLTKKGYQIWAETIAPTVDKLLGKHLLTNNNQNKVRLRKMLKPKAEKINMENNTLQTDKILSLPHPIEKAYCINLDSRPDRWEYAQEQFIATGLKVERFPAVDTADILWDNLEITDRTKFFMSHRATHEDMPSLGAIGCYLSHVSLWQEIVDKNISSALIFEDDIMFTPTFYQRLEAFGEMVSSGDNSSECNEIDALFFRAGLRSGYVKSTPIHSDLGQVTGPFFGTSAYLITNYGARMLLQRVFPIEVQIDAYIGIQAGLEHQLGVFVTKVPIVHNNPKLKSNIQNDLDVFEARSLNWLIVVLCLTTSISFVFCVTQYVIYRREKKRFLALSQVTVM